jgi:inorganic pyrophosphatase
MIVLVGALSRERRSGRRCSVTFPDPFYRWRPHPWHGLEVGPEPPQIVHAYVEITPFDLVKYEIDKVTGYMRVDRPQRTSSQPPTIYGFIPRTYCGRRVHRLSPGAERGDGDPLDICVISERPLARAEVILTARVVGGIQAIDGGEADDKIVAVLDNDEFWRDVKDISQVPDILVERLRHYFSTYKMMPGGTSQMSIERVYDREYAQKVVAAAMEDYGEAYGV